MFEAGFDRSTVVMCKLIVAAIELSRATYGQAIGTSQTSKQLMER